MTSKKVNPNVIYTKYKNIYIFIIKYILCIFKSKKKWNGFHNFESTSLDISVYSCQDWVVTS